MINSPIIGTMALPIQAAVQAATESVIVVPFESTALWIDDCIALLALGY